MIIGNNNNKKVSSIKKPFIEENRSKYHTDVTDKDEMADKSFAILHERYQQGLISLEEFTKQCNKLNKIRQK